MEIVRVHSLRTTLVSGHVEVTFRRFYNDPETTLNCRQHDVLSLRPLQVQLGIPPGARISDMRAYEGKDVILELS